MAWSHKNREDALKCIKNFIKNEGMQDNLIKELLMVFNEVEILNMMDSNNNHIFEMKKNKYIT